MIICLLFSFWLWLNEAWEEDIHQHQDNPSRLDAVQGQPIHSNPFIHPMQEVKVLFFAQIREALGGIQELQHKIPSSPSAGGDGSEDDRKESRESEHDPYTVAQFVQDVSEAFFLPVFVFACVRVHQPCPLVLNPPFLLPHTNHLRGLVSSIFFFFSRIDSSPCVLFFFFLLTSPVVVCLDSLLSSPAW